VPSFRIVNTEDVVPGVPFAVTDDIFATYLYKHAGTPVDFTATYDSTGNNHSMLDCYLYAVNHPAQPEGPLPTGSTCQPAFPPRLRKGMVAS
jgi:triacylglycerol lipase